MRAPLFVCLLAFAASASAGTYALVESSGPNQGAVDNVVMWDGVAPYAPICADGKPCLKIASPDAGGHAAQIGGSWNGTSFAAPQ